jgi:hypothetical protein
MTIQPRLDQKVRVGIAVMAILTIAFVLNLKELHTSLRRLSDLGGRDVISPYVARFEGLRQILPPESVVGYFSDRADVWEWRLLTQYALAPVIVEDSTERQLLIANFQTWGYRLNPERPYKNFKIACDFQNGITLLRKKE